MNPEDDDVDQVKINDTIKLHISYRGEFYCYNFYYVKVSGITARYIRQIEYSEEDKINAEIELFNKAVERIGINNTNTICVVGRPKPYERLKAKFTEFKWKLEDFN